MSYRTFFRRDVVWLWYLAAASVLTAAYLFVPPFKGYAGLINLIGLMSPAAIALGIRMYQPKAVLAWRLLLLGQLLYVVADVYTTRIPICSAAPSASRPPATRSTSSSIQCSLPGSCCSYDGATPAAIGPQSSTP